MIRKLAILLAVLIGFASPAQAYWEYGHETVAAIAYRNVTPQVRAAIDRMLARSYMMETPTCPARTIEQASVWADCIKTLGPRFSYAYTWHFQDMNICHPFDLKAACRDGNCVSAQIDRDVKLLKDAGVPLRERIFALAFLVHFVGDLHQPLHAGDMGDLGGNRMKTDYGIFHTDRLNLHTVWDGYLAERAISTAPSLVRPYTPEERLSIQGGTTEDWSRESWGVAHQAYQIAMDRDPCVAGPPGGTMTEAKIEEMIAPARLQVVRGGLRLARLLNESLGPQPKADAAKGR